MSYPPVEKLFTHVGESVSHTGWVHRLPNGKFLTEPCTAGWDRKEIVRYYVDDISDAWVTHPRLPLLVRRALPDETTPIKVRVTRLVELVNE